MVCLTPPLQFVQNRPTNHQTAVASRQRVLLAGGEQQLENAAQIKAILFDKTGTLTTGILHVHKAGIEVLWKTSPAQIAILWAAIGTIEQHSKHPVAVLLAEESKRQLSQFDQSCNGWDCIVGTSNLRIYDGLGIRATVHTTIGDLDIAIGSPKLMGTIAPGGSASSGFNTALDSAHGIVFISVDGQAAMSVTYSDAIRSDAQSTVQTLQAQGIQVGLVTGDTKKSARHVAAAVGISPKWTFASCLPTDKVRILNQINTRHGPVAMVGDHFNDIPALASSSFSISVRNCSDVSSTIDADAYLPQAARESFDLLRIPYLLALARMTHSKIQVNVLWAIIYNTMALILSSGCLQFIHSNLVITP